MYMDARSLPDRSLVEADVAIIGGGPAGITVARALADSSRSVCLIEAGGLEADADSQALYAGDSVGIEYPLAGSRLRYFGGSSNHWGGYCRPLDGIDFERRDWVRYSGWPFTIDELTPYLDPASQIVEIAPGRFEDKDYWQHATAEPLPDPVTGRMRLSFMHFSPPTRFGPRYGPELERAPNVRMLLHANVSNIAAAAAGQSVTGLDIRTLDGLTHRVRAQVYVLAAGGLENARLLLLSNDVVSPGLGNHNDLVGRFFMEHPHLSGFAEIVVGDLRRLPRIYRERVKVDGRPANAAFGPSERFQRERRLLNATFMVGVGGEYPTPVMYEPDKAVRHLEMLRAARPFLNDWDDPADVVRPERIGHWLGLGCACEQAPNPDSRVTLSSEPDVLGLPRIRLDWRLTEQDRRSVVEHMRSLALEFGALGIGRMLIHVEDDGLWPQRVRGGNHHMGTTRMHDDPQQGVVDRDCRVHGIDNLYVAGSSVFPTSGAANPTLTLVALALRLATHLKSRLQ